MPMWHNRRHLIVPSVVLAAAVTLAGCAGHTAAAPAASSTPSPASDRTLDVAHIEHGPDRAQVGRTYPFDLYVHCAGEYTGFGGYVWQTDTPPGDPGPTLDANGNGTYTGYLPGWMTQTGPDAAVFRSGTRVVEYHRVASAPGCA
jgi:hypothetical protein